jgi:hypothetical protein
VKIDSLRAAAGQQEMRVVTRWPHVDWGKVWTNLRDAPIFESTRAAWYRVIHGIIPTNERLKRINIAQTDVCKYCAEDTLEHRLTVYGEGATMWEYTKQMLAKMTRESPNTIQTDWLIHPQFKIRPLKLHRATLWTLTQVVAVRTQQHQWKLTLQDYLDFLLRSRWKLMGTKRGKESVGISFRCWMRLLCIDWAVRLVGECITTPLCYELRLCLSA